MCLWYLPYVSALFWMTLWKRRGRENLLKDTLIPSHYVALCPVLLQSFLHFRLAAAEPGRLGRVGRGQPVLVLLGPLQLGRRAAPPPPAPPEHGKQSPPGQS